MMIAGPDYKYRGKLAAPGFVLKVMHPTVDKNAGTFHCYLTAYANIDDEEAGEVFHDRMFEVRLYKNANASVHGGPQGPDQPIRLHYAMPEVVYGWGKKPAGESRIAEEDWPSNPYAQAYLLLSFLDEFKEFTSDETIIDTALQGAKERTTLKKKSTPAPAEVGS